MVGMFIIYTPGENRKGKINYLYRILVKNMKERRHVRNIGTVEVQEYNIP
jgi:hypothetical protein